MHKLQCTSQKNLMFYLAKLIHDLKCIMNWQRNVTDWGMVAGGWR